MFFFRNLQQEREHRLRIAEAEHRQRFMEKERQRLMHYTMDPREKEQRELEAKRADDERMRQARQFEEERRAHDQRCVDTKWDLGKKN